MLSSVAARAPAERGPDGRGPAGRRQLAALLAIALGGVALRLLRLGELSLSGDEETTALAALALLEGWPPTLPGGTVYYRGLPFTLLEALSIAAFGAGEGVLRLVPALVAGPRILALGWLARPLIGAPLALVCAGLLALAPLDVELSRTARMYSLFATLDLVFVGAVVHASCGGRRLAAGTAFGMLAALTHRLAVTHAPVAWAAAAGRGLSGRARAGLLLSGTGVFATTLGVALLVRAGYAPSGRTGGGPPAALDAYASGAGSVLADPVSAALAIAGGALALLLGVRGIRTLEWPVARAAAAASLVCFALGSPVFAGVLWLAALLLEGLELGTGLRRTLPLLAAGAVATLAWFAAAARLAGANVGGGEFALRQLLALPAPNWVALVRAAPLLFALACAGLLAAVGRSAASDRSGAWLALVAAALAPALLSGLVESRGELRFQLHALGPLLVLAVLGADALWRRVQGPRLRLALVAATALLAVRPDLSVQAVLREPGPIESPFAVLDVAPDHRGAAAFLSGRLRADEWLAAEDVLQQRFYAGRADVWLRRSGDADRYVRRDPGDGLARDIYTGALHADDLEALRRLARSHGKRVVWLVTSGECEAASDYYRTPELAAELERWRPLAWYEGADGMTRIYRLVDGEPLAPAVRDSEPR